MSVRTALGVVCPLPSRVAYRVAICRVESTRLSDGNCGGAKSRTIERGETGLERYEAWSLGWNRVTTQTEFCGLC